MDTRNYDEKYNCGLESCDCDDDNKCGCTFPNNISDFTCACEKNADCDCIQFDKPTTTYVKDETVCACGPKECDCTGEITMKKQ